MNMVVPAIVFGAVGTAGQRCTSTRRVIIHENIFDDLIEKIISAYKQVQIGDPLVAGTLMGPLVNESAIDDHFSAIAQATSQGGRLLYGGEKVFRKGNFVEPVISRQKIIGILYKRKHSPHTVCNKI